MPFRIDCPHCGKGMRVPTRLAGKVSNCPSCEGVVLFPKIAVAIDPAIDITHAATEPTPVVVSPSRNVYRRRTFPVFASLAMLTLSFGGIFAGYLVLDRLGVLDKPKSIAKVRLSAPKQPPQVVDRQHVPVAPPVQPTVTPPLDVTEPATVIPVVELPKYLQLPDNEDKQIKALLNLPGNNSLTFVSIDSRLTLKNSTLRWTSEDKPSHSVAGLAIRDGVLCFRWLSDSQKEAIAAVYNSVLLVQSPSGNMAIAMRSPVVLRPVNIDLKKIVTRIVFECPFPPPEDNVFFALTTISNFPKFLGSGSSHEKMRIRDECILWYPDAAGVGTKMSFGSRGRQLFIELQTRYRLPSGDECPLTFSRSRKKKKGIESLLKSAEPAAKSDIIRELAALKEVSAFAAVLDNAEALSFRFFTIIDNIEVDLAVSQTRSANLPQKVKTSQTVSGPIVEQKAIPLLKPKSEPIRSGWGNDFVLIGVHAESTAVIDGRLQYNWHVKIRNSKSKHMAIDVFTKLMDADENVLCVSDTQKTALAPNETKVVKGQMDIDPALESKVDSVFAHVKTP